MFKSWIRDITLTIQARSGASPAMFVWNGVIVVASLTAFIFLCVALYVWLSLQLGAVIASLVVAGIFVAIAVIGAIICALVRRRVRKRAIVERAALANSPSSLLDPKILATALQAGRALGWQRIVPIVLLGFMVTQWTREHRENRGEGGPNNRRSDG
jgi:Na+/proline symporter